MENQSNDSYSIVKRHFIFKLMYGSRVNLRLRWTMNNKNKTTWILLLCSLSILTIMSCAAPDWIADFWTRWGEDRPEATIRTSETQLSKNDQGFTSNTTQQWSIYRCNAIRDTTIQLNEFSEHYYRLQTDNNIVCDYNYKILNDGFQPIRIIHYEQLYPSNEYSTPSRWVPFTVVTQPNEYSTVYGWIDQCNDCTPSRHETFTYSIAIVYEIPECQWITEGENPHIDILLIDEYESVMAPCTLLTPMSYSEAKPDLSKGLRP